MGKKIWNEMEISFLKQIYVSKGAIGVSNLIGVFEVSYSMERELFNLILDRLIEKEYCVVEKIKKLDRNEEDIVFITLKGLEKLSKRKNIPVKNIIANKIPYEFKCEGCTSYSEWLEKNREGLVLENEITNMFACSLADMEIVLMCRDNKDEIKKNLQEAIERTKRRTEKIPEIHNTVAYAIVMAIYDKLMKLIDTDILFTEVENAKKLIKSFMSERHESTIDFI